MTFDAGPCQPITSMLHAYWLSDSDDMNSSGVEIWPLMTRHLKLDTVEAIRLLPHRWSTIFTMFRHFIDQTANQLSEKTTANENNR